MAASAKTVNAGNKNAIRRRPSVALEEYSRLLPVFGDTDEPNCEPTRFVQPNVL
jgi:hypothetical protein